MYWLNAPLQLEAGQPVAVTCTLKERLMDFEVTSQGTTCVAGSTLGAAFKSLNAAPSAVLGLDTIANDAPGMEPFTRSSAQRPDCDGCINAIWCPEYSVLRCNDEAWRRAILSDLIRDNIISILCLGDPLGLAPLFYRAEGAHVVLDCADLEEDAEATFDALWDHLHSCPSQELQQMQFLSDMPPRIVFDLIFWDPVESGGLLRGGCFAELIASRTKNSRRNCIIAPCCLILWAQGVTGSLLNDMTEVQGSVACGFDLSVINDYSVRRFCCHLLTQIAFISSFFRCKLYRVSIHASFLPAVARSRSKSMPSTLAVPTFYSSSSQWAALAA